MARRKQEEPAPANRRERLAAMETVAKRFSGFQRPSSVLTRVRSVPTIFPQYDVATRVGGHPIERVTLVHGPSNEGKTIHVLGLELSFLKRDHFVGHVDAEFTTSIDWIEELMGEHANHPGFVAMRPESFETTRDQVKNFAETIGNAREKGEIDKDTSAICVVDSIRKLVPERLMEALQKEASEVGIDGMSGRGAQYRAALLAQWMDEIVPLLFHTKTALVLIARETERPGATKYEPQWVIGGGRAPFYEASLVSRITHSFVKEGPKDSPQIVGERHQVRIWKTKVGGKEGRYVDAYFHTSNGVVSPEGFDPARDVLEMAVASGLVEKQSKSGEKDKGNFYVSPKSGEMLGNGEAKALSYLRATPDTLARLEAECRAAYQAPEGDSDAAAA